MIAKDTATIVRFYVIDTDGFPATGKASSISANISIDGGTAIAITATITESDSTNLPGWYEFEYTFDTAGNAFITFTAANCIIMPWEEEVVEATGASASDIAYAVWSDKRTYPIFQGTPMGYYQANPPIINVWSQQAYPQQSTTYGDLVKGIPTINTNVTAVKSKTDNLPASPAATGDAMTLTSAAITAVQSGLSTFNAATDTVLIDATQAAGMVTATGFATPGDIPTDYAKSSELPDVSGLATSTNVSDAQSAIIRAMPSIPTDYAKASDIPDISGLSTFDPSTDRVLIDATQAAGMATATGFATPANVTAAQTAIINAIPPIPSDYAKSTDIPDISDLATATDVTTAQAAIIDHGDANWTGGGSGGGATAQQIWEYAGGRTITNTIPSVNDIWGRTGQDTTSRTLTDSPTDISGLATAADLADVATTVGAIKAKTDNLPASPAATGDIPSVADIQSGLSTFDPANDKVTLNTTEDGTLTAIKTKVDTLNNTDLTGIATSTDVSDAQTAIIGAMPTIPSDYAKSTDIAAINALLTRIDSGVLHWSTTETTLTLYDDNGDTVKTYTLTRDVQGNITRIVPNNA